MIDNRGVKVWPNGNAWTFCTDSYRCRFLAADADRHGPDCGIYWGVWRVPASPSPPPRRCAPSTGRPDTLWLRGSNRWRKRGALVAVIMGSKSDWETMRQADEMLTRFGVAARMPRAFGASDACRNGGIRKPGGRARYRSHHRRGGRRRSSGGCLRRPHAAAGAGRAHGKRSR